MLHNSDDIMFKLGHKIRYERSKRGFSQEKLAELANINRNFVGMVERGETNITVRKLDKIAKAFGIEAKELLDFRLQ